MITVIIIVSEILTRENHTTRPSGLLMSLFLTKMFVSFDKSDQGCHIFHTGACVFLFQSPRPFEIELENQYTEPRNNVHRLSPVVLALFWGSFHCKLITPHRLVAFLAGRAMCI